MVLSSCRTNGGGQGLGDRKQDKVVGDEAELVQGVQVDTVLWGSREEDSPESGGGQGRNSGLPAPLSPASTRWAKRGPGPPGSQNDAALHWASCQPCSQLTPARGPQLPTASTNSTLPASPLSTSQQPVVIIPRWGS